MASITTVPELAIEVDGDPLARDTRNLLTSVRVQQRLSQPAVCELAFAGDKPAIDGLSGAGLRVRVGDTKEELFTGQVTAVAFQHGPSREQMVRVRAYDALHRLRKRQPVRAFAEVSVVEVARELVSDLGLTVESAASAPAWDRVIQYRQSDLQFLTDLADRCGLYLTLRGDVLYLITLEGVGEELSLALAKSLLEAELEVNGDPACRSVRTLGWDAARTEAHSGSADTPRTARAVEAEAPPDLFGSPGEITLAHEPASNDEQAEALAQAELDARFNREVVFRGTAEGDARLRAGARINVEGISAPFSGTYVVTEAHHRFDRQTGYVTEISSLPPTRQRAPAVPAAVWGNVTNIADPEGLGRVRVSLPSVNDLETYWMEVVCPGAGERKGLIALPDVGDRVLVVFPHGDMAHGAVLGGLYGPDKPPDDGIEGGAVKRYTVLTPGGQKMLLDDAARTIRLETSDGSYIELSPQKLSVNSVVDVEITAPGRAITIAGKKIDFRTK